MKTNTVTPLRSASPLFPGGLYGWKWGILSETSLAQTVPAALPKNQPERREADDHRHRGSVPRRKAAHRQGVPHGELRPTLQSCVYARCGRSLQGWLSDILTQRCASLVCRTSESFVHFCSETQLNNSAVCYINLWYFQIPFPLLTFSWSLFCCHVGSFGGAHSLSLLF